MNTIRKAAHVGETHSLIAWFLSIICLCTAERSRGAEWGQSVCPACGEEFVFLRGIHGGMGDDDRIEVEIDGEGDQSLQDLAGSKLVRRVSAPN